MSRAILELFEGEYTSDGSATIPDGTAAYYPSPDSRMKYVVGEDESGPFLQVHILEGFKPEGMDGMKFRVCGSQVLAAGVKLAENSIVNDIIFLEDSIDSDKHALFHVVNFVIDGKSLFGTWKCH